MSTQNASAKRLYSLRLDETDRKRLQIIADHHGGKASDAVRAWLAEKAGELTDEQTRPDQTGPDQRREAA